ncbi:MAG TPA: serine/threonine-protein kinase, partial [Terriglobales bacterium]
MDPARWEKIAQLYDCACEQPVSARDAFLGLACEGDEDLRREVESLLRQPISVDGPLERVTEQARAAWDCPAQIGQYRIIALIGEGGMGAVYQAEQDHPRRIVALKILKSPLAAPELQRRFSHEADVLGRLQHPNIARIYEAGTAQTDLGPQPYFAMEFIRGVSLLEHAAKCGLDVPQRLNLMISICEAVDYAHRCGVIHRDLKPGNILVDENGEPKILDFGVARVTDADANITRQTALGDLVGTLAYMSPEQLLADPAQLDARSDVYSLGVVTYELLAGRRPYETTQPITDAARVIREEEPTPLGSVNRVLAGDLEIIVAKALEKERERRYGSAAELAADLRRHLAHEPILARRATATYRSRKFIRRHRTMVSATALIFFVLLAGAVVST